jgi:anionic cell wall polymer biosynthesis LytR-Cps2A-Psr (LCP) family protein
VDFFKERGTFMNFNQAQNQYIAKLIKKAKAEEREKTLSEVLKIMKDNSYMYIGRFEEYIINLIKNEQKIEITSSGNPPTGT